MANICWYQIKVKGKKENVYMMYHTTPEYNEKRIFKKSGKKDDYMMIFMGDCKWSLNSYCENSRDDEEVNPLSYITRDGSLFRDVDKYWKYTIKDKSKIFDCEVEVFAQYEDYDYRDNSGDMPLFEHYKNGELLERESLPYEEMRKKEGNCLGYINLIHLYQKEEDNFWEDLLESVAANYKPIDWDSPDSRWPNESTVKENIEENTIIKRESPLLVELQHTELYGGIERAEKYKVGDPVKLKCEKYDWGYGVTVEHELGYVGTFMEEGNYIKELQDSTSNEKPTAKIVEVVPLSQRSKRCKKPLIGVAVYFE